MNTEEQASYPELKVQQTNSTKEHYYHALFLVVSCLLVYSTSLSHDFIPLQDDNAYIIYNSSIRGFSLANIKTAFSIYAGNYAPMHIISYMLDYTISGQKPSGFILTNIILHIINGLLFYHLLVRSRFTPIGASAAACIFLLHPVQVESVVWASERKTVLAMMFFLLAVHSYLNYIAQTGKSGKTTQYLLSLFSFVLAVLSKSVVVILPAVLLIHDLAYRKLDRQWQWLKDKLPYILIALIGVAATIYSQDPGRDGGRTGFHGGSALATFFTMLPVLIKYLRMLFWPTGLSIYYGSIQVKTTIDEDVFLAGLITVALFALGMVLWRKKRELFCWYALFFVGLLPVSQIVPIVTLINDRYLYFPLLGGAAFIIGSVRWIHEIFPRIRVALPVMAVTVFITLAILTYNQTKTWQNTQTLYRQVIRTNPGQIDLKFLEDGFFLFSELNGLMEVTQTLLKNFPSSPEVLRFAGMVYNRTNDPLLARQHLEKAVSANPRDIDLMFLLADNYRKTGNDREAEKLYAAILSRNPESERAKKGLNGL